MRFGERACGVAVMSGIRTVASSQRPGLQALRESVELELPEIVTQLQAMLGAKLVAYVGNVKNTRPVGDWAAGRRAPGKADEERLRLAFQASRLLSERYSATNIQSWMMGANLALEYEAPARLIKNADMAADVARDVMSAAMSFAFVG